MTLSTGYIDPTNNGDTVMNEEIPQGKRTVRRTVRGSMIGYIGRVQWENLGDAFEPYTDEKIAKFLKGE